MKNIKIKIFFTLIVCFLIFQPIKIFAQDKKLPLLIAPNLSVSIPGTKNFTNIDCQAGEICNIPWLAQYIAGLQRYAIGIIGIISVIVLMIGGVLWLASGGNGTQIEKAKKMIVGSIIGLFLTMASYLILFLINPNLTILKSLEITSLSRVDLSELEFVGHEPQTSAPHGQPISDNSFDATFKNFAACVGVDWRVLKGIAFKESHLDPSVVNHAGFTGLFQTKQLYCQESVRIIGLPSSFCNAGVKDPAVNTAVATGMLKTNLSTINNTCASTNDIKKFQMIYFGHSSGGGALKKAIRTYGCDPTTWPSNIFKGATKDYVAQTAATITLLGVTSLNDISGNGQCPK